MSEFVNALKDELESTFKEEISVYFDINLHDGLLELHDVDASLKEKLKCLIFIPIISQTYCDPKSYAWQSEFLPFLSMTENDRFGKDVKLRSGNVASRMLPVRIHDLDQEDINLYEKETGSVLRTIDFVFKTATGVSRPLLCNEDHPNDNLNKTFYRDQINKVAHAIKEIIQGIKAEYIEEDKEKNRSAVTSEGVIRKIELGKAVKTTQRKVLNIRTILVSIILLSLIIIGSLLIPKLFKTEKQLEKSIAVLPFKDLGSDKDQLWFSEGITDVIISQLSKISDLRVLGRTSTLKYREEQESTISEIGNELEVNYLIEGTVQRQGAKMRITVQLIRTRNESHIWSEVYDREWEDIFDIQSDIADRVAEGLKANLTHEEKELIDANQTKNLEAYNLYLQGRFFWNKRNEEGIEKSIEYYEKSITEDNEYAVAYAGLADAYFIQAYWGWTSREEGYDKAKEYTLKALSINKNLAEAHATLGWIYCWSEWKWENARKELKLATELDPHYANAHQYYSELLDVLRENSEARRQIDLAIQLDPLIPVYHWQSRRCYYNSGKFNESLEECRKLQEVDPTYGRNYSIPWLFFYNYVQLNEGIKAVEELQKVFVADPLRAEYVDLVKESFNQSGIEGIFDLLIELELKTENPDPYRLARWYSLLNKKNNALDWLEKTMENPPSGFASINNLSDFNNLRSEPRFQAVINKMGLSEYQEPK